LQEYDFELNHIPGKSNMKVDYLLRWAGHERGEENNEDITVLPPKLFKTLVRWARKQKHDIPPKNTRVNKRKRKNWEIHARKNKKQQSILVRNWRCTWCTWWRFMFHGMKN
jgi:hypothetical protein